MWRQLAYHAAIENDSVGAVAGRIIQKREIRESAERRGRDVAELMVLASRERIEKFQEKLRLLEQACYEALAENEQKLKAAEERLADTRSKAYEITMPDGRLTKVYRDGDRVREQSGALVSPDWIKADDIPPSCPTWQRQVDEENVVNKIRAERRELVEYSERIQQNKAYTRRDGLTDDDVDALESDTNRRMPASVREKFEDMTLGRPSATARPALVVEAARRSAGAQAARPEDQDFMNAMPSVSAPAPR